MIPLYIALVSEIEDLELGEVAKVAGALQKQVSRDFSPIWGVNSVVSAFARLEDVPIGYWPVTIAEDIGYEGAAGIHLDRDGQPFALVQFSDDWALTASHEVLEMLADPYGNRLIAGDSIKAGQGRVEYLVEVSDPSEAKQFGYTVNGVLVSDFYTPRYFDPVASAGVQYSFTGAITKPRQVLRGGYLSWKNPIDNHWHQARFFSTKLQYVDLGPLTIKGSIRATIDEKTFKAHAKKELKGKARQAALASSALMTKAEEKGVLHKSVLVGAAVVSSATSSKAESWRSQIASLRSAAKGDA